MKKILFSVCLFCACAEGFSHKLDIYPVPQGIVYSMHCDDFTVQARTPGGEWQDLYEYKVQVDADTRSEASMVQFDFEGTVEVKVKVNNGLVNGVKIRPLNRDIRHVQKDNVIYLTLDRPAKLSLEVNGDRLHNLHIFANGTEKETYREGDANVMYFGAGMHKPAEGNNSFTVPSNTVVYLAPGAVVQGKFVCDRVENVRFLGRGFLLEPQRGFEITFSKNIEIDGITVINPQHYTVYGGQTAGLKVNNLKSFSNKGWSDGIDLMSCSDVSINDIFMRNSDDCIAIYGHRWDYYGDARNYVVRNAILWADIAHPVNIGLHGNADGDGETVENLHFSDMDILEHDEDDRNYQGCMALTVSDKNLVKDVTFENVRVENIQEGQLFSLRVLYNEKYSAAPGRGIRNVTFRNISYCGEDGNPSIIEGYDEQRQIENVLFDGIYINNKKINTLPEAGIKVGNFTKGIIMK
ncbi:MAG: glycoside hydrolase [Tannerella sp.]|jgi:polygalacturonase|nr:glycoside hydrolase [Tannerella sp.]